MKREVDYTWRLAQLMAAHGLLPLLPIRPMATNIRKPNARGYQ